jgi:uncharacterized protein (DUF2141 family)
LATVTVVVASVEADQPSITAAQGGISISISNGSAAQVIAAAPYQAVFENVAPGSYTASAVAQDVNGNAVGTAITSEAFTVAAPVSYNIPQSITVTVGS